MVACERCFAYGFMPGTRFQQNEMANAVLIDPLREEAPLYKWDGSRFYGPFENNEVGYTIYPTREFASASDSLKTQLAG
jgi:hypothetical protein